MSDLSMALNKNTFNRQECHQRATQQFNADVMAKKYLAIYERVISGEFLNHSPPVMRETAVQLPWHLD